MFMNSTLRPEAKESKAVLLKVDSGLKRLGQSH